jgi:OFA family oxalate/formate antiporter-like MFS transporter
LLIAHLRQSSGSYASGLHVIAGVMAVSVLLPILVSPPKSDRVNAAKGATAIPAMQSK